VGTGHQARQDVDHGNRPDQQQAPTAGEDGRALVVMAFVHKIASLL